jgi:hypothetical protein
MHEVGNFSLSISKYKTAQWNILHISLSKQQLIKLRTKVLTLHYQKASGTIAYFKKPAYIRPNSPDTSHFTSSSGPFSSTVYDRSGITKLLGIGCAAMTRMGGRSGLLPPREGVELKQPHMAGSCGGLLGALRVNRISETDEKVGDCEHDMGWTAARVFYTSP